MTVMQKAFKAAAIAIVIILVALTIGGFVVWNSQGRPSFGRAESIAPPITMDTSNFTGFAADALYLVQMIEQTHPIFIVDTWLSDNYEAERSRFLTYAQNANITQRDFAFAAARYINMLRDGHMSGWGGIWSEDNDFWRPAIFGGDLDISWEIHNGQLLLLDEEGNKSGISVAKIGGVATEQVFSIINSYYYAENEADSKHNYARFSRFADVIERAGGEILNNTVVLTLYNNGELSNR